MTTTNVRDEIARAGGLVTKADIARMCGVSHEAVRKWTQREDFPESIGMVGAESAQPQGVWLRNDITGWRKP